MIKEGIFVGSLIHQLLDNEDFEATMDELEKAVLHAFKDVCKGFLGKLVSNCLVYPASKSLMTIRHCSLFISSNGGK